MRDISVRKRVTAINIKITKSYNFFIMICASMCWYKSITYTNAMLYDNYISKKTMKCENKWITIKQIIYPGV